jgi:hypothetical protein
VKTALALVLVALGCGKHEPPADRAPRTTGPIQIDGEWDEPDWAKTARRAQLLGGDGQLARPSSEVRFLRDDKDLLLALYGADENIESRDAFDVTIGTVALHVAATGQVTPTVPGLRAKSGFDEGTLDNPKDDDEEWVVEVAVPLGAVGLEPGVHRDVRVARCAVPKEGVKRGAWWWGTISTE